MQDIGITEISYQLVRSAEDLLLKIDCKYCKKSVKPIVTGVWQIVCSECEYRLTHDFFTKEQLK
ncbi:MAG: hypothetical protein ACFFDF_18915 [Candidatus Odinarchaeota archaeon]